MSESADNTKKTIRRNRTRLNSIYRLDIGVNSRRYPNGMPIETACGTDANGKWIWHELDQETEKGGKVTPFNILCTATGACAVRQVIFDNDETTVLFDDGDRVVVKRHSSDVNDSITAVLWAIGEKVFGEDLARQIKRVIKYRGVDRNELRNRKVERKASETKPNA